MTKRLHHKPIIVPRCNGVFALLALLTVFVVSLPVQAAVSVDTAGFNPDANGIVHSVVQQADGKVLIGGEFTSINGVPRNRIARLNADGSLDAGFDPDGGANFQVRALAPQADGKVLIGGSFTGVNGITRNYIARLNADGSLDTGFDPGTGANNEVLAVAPQADGKVLISGLFTSVNGVARNRIARLNADGSLDPSFDPGSGANDGPLTLAQQADGKVLIGGEFTSVNGVPRNRIARLNADGSLDAGFDPDGGANFQVRALAPQAENKVLIGGHFTSIDGVTRNYIARLNADGSLDAGFDSGTGANNEVLAVAPQADGKVLISGLFTSVNGVARNRIARLNADGSLDPSFDPGSGANDGPLTLAQQADGKVLIGGWFTSVNGIGRNYLARLNANGSPDAGFDPGTGANDEVRAVAQQADGKVLIGGHFTSIDGVTRNYIARLNADGSLDAGFDSGTGANYWVRAVAQQADGKVLIGGYFTSINGVECTRIARLNTDGSLDTDFGPDLGPLAIVLALAEQADGKVLMGGWIRTVNGVVRNGIARLKTDGSLDLSFNPATNWHWVYALAQQPDGKILISGGFWQGDGAVHGITRLHTDGSLDTSFDGTGPSGNVLALALQADGKVLIGGWFQSVDGVARNRIARLNADGSLDTSFDPGTGTNGWVYALALQADGKVLIGGSFSTFNGVARAGIARLHADGSLDSSFDLGSGTNSTIYGLAQQADGKVLIGGIFTSVNGVARNRIARLSLDAAALQNLYAAANGRSVTWLRNGTGPVLDWVTFEVADNLVGGWTPLGNGRRIAGGWTLSRLNLPFEQIRYIRARGFYGTGSRTESIRQIYLPTPPPDDSFCFPIKAANGNVAVICL